MKFNDPDLKKHSAIVIHASATKPSMDIGVKEIRSWHVSPPRSWSDIGYHLVIRRDGSLEKGRDWDRQGAHASGFNRNPEDGKLTFGICLVGGVTENNVNIAEDNFTDKQWSTLNRILKEIVEYTGIKEIVGHNQLSNHSSRGCPSFNSKIYVDWFFKSIKALHLPSDWYDHSKYNWHDIDPETWNLPNTFMDEVDTGGNKD